MQIPPGLFPSLDEARGSDHHIFFFKKFEPSIDKGYAAPIWMTFK
jgi:hypothetical protein